MSCSFVSCQDMELQMPFSYSSKRERFAQWTWRTLGAVLKSSETKWLFQRWFYGPGRITSRFSVEPSVNHYSTANIILRNEIKILKRVALCWWFTIGWRVNWFFNRVTRYLYTLQKLKRQQFHPQPVLEVFCAWEMLWYCM